MTYNLRVSQLTNVKVCVLFLLLIYQQLHGERFIYYINLQNYDFDQYFLRRKKRTNLFVALGCFTGYRE